ncbi:hypothetical protein ACQV2X_02055 [Facklamia sp. P12945]|uniref:hypothetical protein n=1 Tax=unclassified Facklamia TaxID=2622293 RepID=UPI003D16FA60
MKFEMFKLIKNNKGTFLERVNKYRSRRIKQLKEKNYSIEELHFLIACYEAEQIILMEEAQNAKDLDDFRDYFMAAYDIHADTEEIRKQLKLY